MNTCNKTSNYHINSSLPRMHEKKMPTNPTKKALQYVSRIKSISCEKCDSVHKTTTTVIQDGGPAAQRGKTDKELFPNACKKATREK